MNKPRHFSALNIGSGEAPVEKVEPRAIAEEIEFSNARYIKNESDHVHVITVRGWNVCIKPGQVFDLMGLSYVGQGQPEARGFGT